MNDNVNQGLARIGERLVQIETEIRKAEASITAPRLLTKAELEARDDRIYHSDLIWERSHNQDRRMKPCVGREDE